MLLLDLNIETMWNIWGETLSDMLAELYFYGGNVSINGKHIVHLIYTEDGSKIWIS